MATITICDRLTDGNSSRRRVSGVEISGTVSDFKELIAKNSDTPSKSFDLIYCGQSLKGDASLDSYGLHSGSTVHLLPSIVTTTPKPKEESNTPNPEIKRLIKLLQTALKNPAYKSTVENIFSCPDKLHDIVNAIPGLDANPSTLTLFMDLDLLKVLAHPGNVRRLLEAHPCFPELAGVIAERVTEAGKSGQFTSASSGSYSLDHMSDDDDDGAGPSGGAAITANQLAAALAAATGAPPVIPTSDASQTGQGQAIGNNMITQDFFQQAIMQAQSSSNLTGQIQQMREMGITDENVARQALQATNGNLQAALDLLLEGGLNS